MKRNYIVPILLTVIFTIAVVVRFSWLGTIPPGLTDDEAIKGYDAYSLLETGRDQWKESWPLVAFKGFGDYRSPLYTYLIIPTIQVFGLTPFAVRFPSALLGSFTVVLTFVFVLELFRGHKQVIPIALLSSLLLTISPWHIGMSRIGHEVTVAVCIIISGLTVMLAARRRLQLLPVAGLLFGLSMYVYPASTIFVPIIIILCITLFRHNFPRKYFRPLVGMAIIIILISIPTVTALWVRLEQVSFTRDSGMIDRLNEKRGDCNRVFSPVVCRVVLNKYTVYFERLMTNYYYHFSPNLLGVSGTTTQYSILPPRGILYLIEIPLFLVGVFVAFHLKSKPGIFLALYLLASAIPDSMTGTGHYGRYFISLPAWQILVAIGIFAIASLGKKYRILLVGIVCIYLLEVTTFAFEYITHFPVRYSVYSHYGYKELVQQIVRFQSQYDKIYVSSQFNDAKHYIFYLFYSQYDPISFQNGLDVEKGLDTLGWVAVRRVGSVYFVSNLPATSRQYAPEDRELFIGAPAEFLKGTNTQAKFVIRDLKGDILFQAVDARDLVVK